MSKLVVNLLNENQEILDYLSHSRLFGHLPPEMLEKIIPISKIFDAPQGTELLTEGQINDQVYFLIRGEVEIYAAGELILTLRRIGDIFGEMSVISDKPTSASVIAKTNVNVFSLRSRDVGEYSDLNPEELQNILYRVFAMILTEKLSLTTHKAKQFETTNRTLHETQEQLKQSYSNLEKITDTFRLFVPKQFTDRISNEEDSQSLVKFQPGHLLNEEEATVLFSDIRSFTNVSEQMSSEETFDFLNAYLAFMEPCITENDGFIDKFIGDAIMAIFPAPQDALQAALAMKEAVKEHNQQRLEEEKFPINFGIGIHTGFVMVGLLGTQNRLESTVIGDTVNLASRLEGLTKQYGVQILISEQAYEKLTVRKHTRLIDRVIVQGREAPLNVYEAFGCETRDVVQQKEGIMTKFKEGFQLYLNRDFPQARKLFEECHQNCPRDLVTRMYIGRCAYLMEHVPSEDWDGIFQKRSTRYWVEDVPAILFFEYAQGKPIATQIRNISKTGILINIGHHIELYHGESVLVEIAMAGFKIESLMDPPPLKIWCQIRRRKPGPVRDMKPTLEFGLEFTQISEEEQLILQNTLDQLR